MPNSDDHLYVDNMNFEEAPKPLNKQFSVSLWSRRSSLLHSAVLHADKDKVIQIIYGKEIDIDVVDHWHRTPLFYAVLINNQELVEILIEAHANIELCDIYQRTPLHEAADKGYHGCLKILLSALEKVYSSLKVVDDGSIRPTFHCTDVSGIHPYHLAARLHNIKCLQILLKYPFLGSIDCKDKNKRTPLHWAAVHGLDENVIYLLKHKADSSFADNDGRLPLHWAAFSPKESSKECLQALICVAPTHINKQDSNGATPLHLAVLTGHVEKVETLLSNRVCLVNAVDTKDRSPLHYACSRGFLQIIKSLISFGAEVNKKDIYQATPLHYAALHNRSQVIEMMLQHPHIEDATTLDGETPLHWAVYAGAKAALVRLKSHAASLTRSNKEGETALHIAAKKRECSSSTVDVLLKMKAPTDIKTNDGNTPLHFAAQEGHMIIVKQLLKADPTCLHLENKTGKNALHFAAMEGHLHLTQVLIEAGIPVDCSDAYGRSCLHLAAFVGHSDILCLLLENKANVNARDNEGKTVLHWASMEGHVNAVTTLLNYGASPSCIDAGEPSLTPLDCAIKMDKKEVIKTLTSVGAVTYSTIQNIAAFVIQRNWKSFSFRKRINEMYFSKVVDLMKNIDYQSSRSHVAGLLDVSNYPQFYYSENNSPVNKQDLVLNPLTTPYFPHELRNISESECRPEEETHYANRNLYADSTLENDSRRFPSTGVDQIITNDAIGLSVRIPQGEELAAAQSAWRQRLSGLTLTRHSKKE